jgi:hypothetical protein
MGGRGAKSKRDNKKKGGVLVSSSSVVCNNVWTAKKRIGRSVQGSQGKKQLIASGKSMMETKGKEAGQRVRGHSRHKVNASPPFLLFSSTLLCSFFKQVSLG